MKTSSLVGAFLLLSNLGILVQGANTPVPDATPYRVVERGPDHQVWQRETYEPRPNGTYTTQVHQYVELSSGLNFFDNGQWVESKAEIDLLPDGSGAVATKGQHQVFFPADIYSGAIELVTRDGKHLHARPLGISYDDGTNTVMIATLTNSVGQILASGNQVIYTNAFSEFAADLVCTYRRSGFECDLVFRAAPPTPKDLGLSQKSTRIQLLTEFFNTSDPDQIYETENLADGMTDQTLTFGKLKMVPGRAFMVGEIPSAIPDPAQSIKVSKQWMKIEGRKFLIEEVPYRKLRTQLQALPSPRTTASTATTGGKMLLSMKRVLPAQRSVVSVKRPMRLASLDWKQAPGVVLDYTTVNANVTNFTFQGDTTYFINGEYNLYGTTTIEGGAVIKYGGASNAPSVNIYGPVNCRTAPYRPVVLTAMDDNSVGESISGSTGNPTGTYANRALDCYNSVTLKNLRISYANIGVVLDGGSSNVVQDCQIINCATPVRVYQTTDTRILNVLFGNVAGTAINSYQSTVTAEHVTAHNVGLLWTNDSSTLNLTNSLLIGVTNLGSTFSGGFNATNASDAGIFQIAGGGGHYLATNSPYHNAGTNNIDPALLADIRTKTTYPPIIYTNQSIYGPTNFSPQAQRDTNSKPDLGYHYDPLDFAFGGCDVYTNITFTAGTAVGWFRTSSGWEHTGQGIHMDDRQTCSFNGTLSAPCYWVRLITVQEADVTGGYGPGGLTSWADQNGPYTNAAKVVSRFLRTSGLAGYDNAFRDDSGILIGRFTDCEFYSGGVGSYVSSYYFTNCLFFRSGTGLWEGEPGVEFYVGNCTFLGGFFGYTPTNSNPIIVQNTTFDGTSFDVRNNGADTNYAAYDHNAYTSSSSPFPIGGAHDISLTNGFNWQTSWLGSFYLPSDSPLINAGSTTADQVGLYHFTTQTNQLEEANSIVDIGYHHVAVDANGNPVDTDGNGIPDYIQDPSGNSNNLFWAVGNGNWDIGTTANWKNAQGSSPLKYYDGVPVNFDDTAIGTSFIYMSIAATVSPFSVTVSLTNKTYKLYGSAIAGNGTLVKNGSGKLMLGNTNTYAGGTVINGGTLQLGDGYALGGVVVGNLTINAGTLFVTNKGAVNASSGILNIGTMAGASGTVTMSSGSSITVQSLLATNVAATNLSVFNLNGGTLTTANNTGSGYAANILLASNANWTVNGNWSLNGGTNLIGSMAKNSDPTNYVYVGNGSNNVQVNVNFNAVWFHAFPATGSATNILGLVIGNGNATNNVFTVNGGTLIVTNRPGAITPVTIGKSGSSTGNQLIITNGGQVFTSCRQEYGLVSGQIGYGNGNNNSAIVAGANGAGVKATWNMGKDRLVIGNGNSFGNWMRVDQGGVITNCQVYEFARNSSLFITNGGKLYANAVTVGRSAINNQLIVGGTDGAGNPATLSIYGGGKLVIGGGSVSSANPGTNSLVQVDAGGVVTNAAAISIGGSSTAWDANCINNVLVITNGGRVYSAGTNTIGLLSGCNGNGLSVGGGLSGSFWNLNNQSLIIGNDAQAANNFVTLFTGGLLTNVTTVILGGMNSVLNFNGGTLVACGSGNLIATNGTTVNPTNYVLAGGAVIDTGVYAVTDPLPLLQNTNSPNGGLTKLGSGTLTLPGVNTYTGPTVVSAGSLMIVGAGQLGEGNYPGNITNNGAITFGSSSSQILGGVISGSGSLTNWGTGMLTLSNMNSYSGATIIYAGELVGVTGGSCSNSAVTIMAGATNGVMMTMNNGQWSCGGLTFNAGSYVDFNFNGQIPGTNTAPLQVQGNLALTNVNLVVRNISGTLGAGLYPLIQYTGTLTGWQTNAPSSLPALPVGGSVVVTNNVSNKIIGLLVTVDATRTWAVGNGNWDINTTANWRNDAGVSATYLNGINVTLDDSASGTSPILVMNSAVVSPGSVTANVTNKSYVISGSAIAGSGLLTKNGTGTLTLAGVNTFNGATVVNAGELVGVTGGSCSNSAVTVLGGATNGVLVSVTNSPWVCGGLSLSSGSYVDLNFGNGKPGQSVAPLQAMNTFAFTNPTIIIRTASSLTNGQYPLIGYGALSGTGIGNVTFIPALAGNLSYSLITNAVRSTIDLVIVSTNSGGALSWAAGNGLWDINVSANWQNCGVTGFYYQDGKNVILDDSASGTSPILVMNSAVVSPGSVTANVTNKSYVISGSAIAGSGSLIKNGTGTLTLAGTNSYSGNTTINGGLLVVTNGGTINSPDATLLINTGTNTLANGGVITVGTLLSTNVELGGSIRSVLNFNGGTLTTSNNNGLAANILVASNTVYSVSGNWNMMGGTNYVTSVQLKGVFNNVTLGKNAANTLVTVDNAVLSLANPTAYAISPTNLMSLYVGNGVGSNNVLNITNGGQVYCGAYNGSGLAGLGIGATANSPNNGVIVSGANIDRQKSSLDLGGSRLYIGAAGSISTNDWILVDGGIITNVGGFQGGVYTYGVGSSLVITNGGQIYGNGGVSVVGRMGLTNNWLVSGTDNLGNPSIFNNGGGNLNIGGVNGLSDSTYSGTNNWLWVGQGGLMTNLSHIYVGGDTNALNNGMVITNGGQVFSHGTSLIGSQENANNNYVIVGGSFGNTNSLWNLGNASLTIGSSTDWNINNYATLCTGGVMTNVFSVILGGYNSQFIFNGGTLAAGSNGSLIKTSDTAIEANVYVVRGGAVIDSIAYNVTNTLPLQGGSWSGYGEYGLTKLGSGKLTLSGDNYYYGPTLISAGTLVLSGSTRISSSPNITLAGGAGLDVSDLDNTFILNAWQTLSNSSTGAILNGNLDCSSGVVSLIYDGTNASFIITNGTLMLSTNTVFNLNNTGASLSPGSYEIIANVTAGNAGWVAGSEPTNLTFTGGALLGTASLQIMNDALYLDVGGRISTIAYGSTNLVYNGSAQGPTVTINGSTGVQTTNYTGISVGYGPSVNAPTNVGIYLISNTLAADANYLATINSTIFIIYPRAVATVGFSATNTGLALNPAFCGLSYEKSKLTGSLFVSNNISLINMFSQIAPAVLRIGGNSVDTTCWGGLSNQTAITTTQVDAFAGFVKALPTNWHVIYGINLATNTPANCAAEAAYAANALGSSLLGFEVGNEPDDYSGNGITTYAQFLAQWKTFAAAITNTVPGWAITNRGKGWTLIGPVSGNNTTVYTKPFATNEAGVISMLTQHYYRGDGQSTSSTMALLLSPDTSLAGTVSNIVSVATWAQLPLGFRMGECGSFYHGGNAVSSQYGAALWTLDFMFTVALNGGQGVNFHSGGQGFNSYTPIADNGSAVVMARPEFYGLKLFSLVGQGSVLSASVSLDTNVNFTAYGVRQASGVMGAVLINKDTNYGVQVTINLGSNVTAAASMMLSGPALSSTNGYTLGGAPINSDGSWNGGYQLVTPATNSQLTVAVPPATAVWLCPITGGTNITVSIITQPQSQTVTEGSPATFSVVAGGITPFSYQWQKTASDIAGATMNSYGISNVTVNNQANYRVVVLDRLGNSITSSNAGLSVVAAPNTNSFFNVIITAPRNGATIP